jgi:hypothetical protein
MFERAEFDADGVELDPRDVPPAPRTTLALRELPRLEAVLDARPDALEPTDQLELAHQLTSCSATLDWMRCKTVTGFALRERSNPLVLSVINVRGGVSMVSLGGVDTPEVPESVLPEIALAIGCSEHAARDLVAVGLDLRFRLPQTNNDFGGGRITYAHAKVISETTRELSVDRVETVDGRLAEAAQTRTPPRLRILARRLVAKADSTAMARRRQREYDARSTAMFPTGDGIGAFCVNHDLTTMCVIDDHLSAWATHRRHLDPTTSFAAHKADAAAHLLLGQHPLTGRRLIGPNEPSPTLTVATCGTTAHGTAAATTPADRETSSQQPSPEDLSPAWPAPGSDFESQYAQWPKIPTVADPTCFLPVRTELRVHISADTVLGIDDETCELEGHGPLTADQARHLALQSASTTLRRVFTDPADNSVLFLDARTYRFKRDQAEAIATIHPISCFPGATTPASRCDSDHRKPYRFGTCRAPGPPGQTPPGQTPPGQTIVSDAHDPPGQTIVSDAHDPPGQTLVANGQPLGRRHHRIRTHLGWTAVADPQDAHAITWTSPHGRTYIVHDHEGA